MQAKQIATRLAQNAEILAQYLLPRGKRIGKEWCIGSIEGEIGKSLKVCLVGEKAGLWSDFSTGESGDLLDLWSQTKNISLRAALIEAKAYLGLSNMKIVAPATKIYARPRKDRYAPVGDLSDVMKYLIEERKLPKEIIHAFKVGEFNGQIVFPYFRENELIQIKYLSLKRPNGKKEIRVEANCEPCLFGWQALSPQSRTVTLTEGEIDAMTLHQYGIAALSVPFGGGTGAKHQWLETEFDYLNCFDEIYLCLDNDEIGKTTTAELVERLGRHRCRIVELPHKDANTCLQAGMTQIEIKKCFENARTLDPQELKSAESFVENVVKQFHPTANYDAGIAFPWEKTKGKLSMRPAELSLWTGINGHGKSQILGQIILHSIANGARVCIASLELKPERLLMRLTRQAGALDEPTPEYIRAIHAWYGNRLWLFDVTGTAKAEKLLEVFLYARQRCGVDTFVIDSLMKCGFSEDDYNAHKLFVEQLCDFKNEHHCHIHLVAHPRKGQDENTPPNKLDIKGSGSLSDLADNCFTVWRNKPKEAALQASGERNIDPTLLEKPDCLLICDKQRNGEWEGKIALWFDKRSFQYLNHKTEHSKRYVDFSNPIIRNPMAA